MTTPTIKFRGVRIDDGEYVYGNLFIFRSKCEIMPQSGRGLIESTEVHPDSVAQYTCMNDRNGKEIYGSIYLDGKLTNGGDIIEAAQYNPTRMVIEFAEGGFAATHPSLEGYPLDIVTFYPSIGCQIEVLGSLFMNPELLK